MSPAVRRFPHWFVSLLQLSFCQRHLHSPPQNVDMKLSAWLPKCSPYPTTSHPNLRKTVHFKNPPMNALLRVFYVYLILMLLLLNCFIWCFYSLSRKRVSRKALLLIKCIIIKVQAIQILKSQIISYWVQFAWFDLVIVMFASGKKLVNRIKRTTKTSLTQLMLCFVTGCWTWKERLIETPSMSKHLSKPWNFSQLVLRTSGPPGAGSGSALGVSHDGLTWNTCKGK